MVSYGSIVRGIEYGVSEEYKLIVPIVSRCGSTYLRMVLKLKPINKETVIKLKSQGYSVIATYRNPIDRWVSTYQRFFLEKNIPNKYWGSNINSKYAKDISNYLEETVSIEDFLEYTKDELQKNPLEIDQHIRRQVDSYDISLVDRFICVNNIDDFLISIGATPNNKKHNSVILYKEALSEEVIKELTTLYQEDFKLSEYDKYSNISI